MCIVADMLSAAQIQKARRDSGDTQMEFARRIGVDQSTISRWEQDGISDRLTSIAVESILKQVKTARASEAA